MSLHQPPFDPDEVRKAKLRRNRRVKAARKAGRMRAQMRAQAAVKAPLPFDVGFPVDPV